MQVDKILAYPQYRLRSRSKLAIRDDHYARIWLDGLDPLYEVYWRVRNRSLVPRKEFYETAFVLDRLKDVLGEYRFIIEMAAGHGMLGLFSTLLHPGIRQVVHIDFNKPPCYGKVLEALAPFYPFLKVKSRYLERSIESLSVLPPEAFVLGVHCCGGLTDRVAELAFASKSDFAVIPCCESFMQLPPEMEGKVHGSVLPDILGNIRKERWQRWGYDVEERSIPLAVTERARLFLARYRGKTSSSG